MFLQDSDYWFYSRRALPGETPDFSTTGRVISVSRGLWLVATAGVRDWLPATAAASPAFGDWVRLRTPHGPIVEVLPRLSVFERLEPGQGGARQVLAANADTIVLLMGLDGDWNPRRLERMLALAWASGSDPVVVLNKRDLAADPAGRVREAAALAGNAPVLAISALSGEGCEPLTDWLTPSSTTVLAGSSGAGKSTLLNRLLGAAIQVTREVRASDSRGRHTTTRRELFRLPNGAWVGDLPGVREWQLTREADLDGTFADVEYLAALCRFSDCSHTSEPGCAVRRAIGQGQLAEERLLSLQKLQREQAYLIRQSDPAAAREARGEERRIHRIYRKQIRQR